VIVPEDWELPSKIVQRLGPRTAGRQRALDAAGHMVLVLHEPPGPHDSERVAKLYWRDPLGQWRAQEGGPGLLELQAHLARYRETEDRLEFAYRGAGRARDYFDLLERLTPLHRAARNLRTTLQAAREQIPGDRDLLGLRDEAEAIDRSLEILETDARNGLEFEMARSAEKQARTGEAAARAGHRLNIMAALFFPITAIASIFGINMPLGIETAPHWLGWGILAAALALGIATLWWVLSSRAAED
jgi:hypothetical protein